MAEPFLSQIIMFGGNFVIRGYAECNGMQLAISQNQALYSLLGSTYGGDDRTVFGLPDLRGRVPIDFGQGPGTSHYPLGARLGTETETLTVAQLPSHFHAFHASGTTADRVDPTGHVVAPGKTGGSDVKEFTVATPGAQMSAQEIAPAGAGQPHDNMMPSLAINFQISLAGVYPSRE